MGNRLNYQICGGIPPPQHVVKGGSLRTLVRRGPVSPDNVVEKRKEKMCVLDKVCGHLASA